MNRTKQAIGMIAALLVLVAALGATASIASAATTEMHNQTYAVDDDTEALRVTAENVTNGTANVTMYELGTDGNETQVFTGTLDTSNSSVTMDSVEYGGPFNASLDYRVLVEGDGADSLSVEEVTTVAASGGGDSATLSDLSGTQQMYVLAFVVLFVVLLAAWYVRENLDTGRY